MKITRILILPSLVLAGFALSLPARAADYVIDNNGAHASINFRIQHLGYSWVTGRFDTFSGTFSYDKDNPAAAKVSVEIDTNSVNTNQAERDKHLRTADFLDVAKYPKATFVSKKVEPGNDGTAKITGDLTLHGVTREIIIDARLVGEGKDPWGGYRAGFSGSTKIALPDFAIKMDLGPASREVLFDLNIEGVRQ